MRIVIFIALFFIGLNNISHGQKVVTISSSSGKYTFFENKVFKGSDTADSCLLYTIRNLKIYRDSSTLDKDIILSIVKDKVYSYDLNGQKKLLLYLENTNVFLRTKKGKYEYCGQLDVKAKELTIIGYLQPIEYIAMLISIGRIVVN